MTERQRDAAQTLADQIKALADQATADMTERQRVRTERADQPESPPRERAVFGALLVAVPVLLILVAIIFQQPLMEWLTPAPSADVALQRAQAALDDTVKEIEAFRHDFSALPETLVQVAAPAHGNWTYTKGSDGRYRVVLRVDGQVVTFDSSERNGVADDRRP